MVWYLAGTTQPDVLTATVGSLTVTFTGVSATTTTLVGWSATTTFVSTSVVVFSPTLVLVVV